ncbi:MAG TPA: bifunctional diaminohydroxyphosphoribosylaminopyrimidine deaminase/5-amino-6-(5-phosphoribosylamino)uracil reductase RibD [Steroidobacteraceae bacterium]
MTATVAAALSVDDHRHMAQALRLAHRGLYSTAPNPAVGCVVVDAQGTVVGQGWHVKAGEAHAEVVALRAAGAAARGATVYVNLEPCAHFGRTPPCAEALLEAGVGRVVAAMRDPNPRVNGGGLQKLAQAGVATASGLMEAETRELNRGFVSRMERGRPWVTLKMAMSLDGRTALANGASQWITGPAARSDVQKLRARAAAILTGSGTVFADDPALTVRDPSLDLLGRRPLRVVLDTALRLPVERKVFGPEAPTLVLCGEQAAVERMAALRAAGVEVQPVASGANGLVLDAVLAQLAAAQCNEVLVEAGATLAGAFVAAGLVDEIVCYVAGTLLGETARPLLRLPALERMDQRQEFRWRDVRAVGTDLRLTLRAT